MPYTLIKGEFHIHNPVAPLQGPEPDGDTLRFKPDRRALIDALPRPNHPAPFNLAGITGVRFEGIDALETHFSVSGDEFHQRLPLAVAARDELLDRAGFGAIAWSETHPFKATAVEHHPVRGYILSAGLDTYGRAVSFVFVGDHPGVDGMRVFATEDTLATSLNAHMLRVGHAYPAFYLGLPVDLREYLRGLVREAREQRVGLWALAEDALGAPVSLTGLADLQQRVIWPKLFRRLAPYFQQGHLSLDALDGWLREDPMNRDDRLLLPTLELGNMHDMIVASGSTLRLVYAPEDVVIVPDDYVLQAPVPTPIPRPTLHGDIRIVAALIDPHGEADRNHESVTLMNIGNADIDLTGWRIADARGQQALGGIIGRGEAQRVRLGSSVQLNNSRDTISVLDAAGRLVDQVTYEPRSLPEAGRSLIF